MFLVPEDHPFPLLLSVPEQPMNQQTALSPSALSLGRRNALLRPEALALGPHRFTSFLSLSGEKRTISFTRAKPQLSEHLHSMIKHATNHHSLLSGETEKQQLNLQRQHNKDAQLQTTFAPTAHFPKTLTYAKKEKPSIWARGLQVTLFFLWKAFYLRGTLLQQAL